MAPPHCVMNKGVYSPLKSLSTLQNCIYIISDKNGCYKYVQMQGTGMIPRDWTGAWQDELNYSWSVLGPSWRPSLLESGHDISFSLDADIGKMKPGLMNELPTIILWILFYYYYKGFVNNQSLYFNFCVAPLLNAGTGRGRINKQGLPERVYFELSCSTVWESSWDVLASFNYILQKSKVQRSNAAKTRPTSGTQTDLHVSLRKRTL